MGKARIAQLLAWLRNRLDEFSYEDEATETDAREDIKQATTQVQRTPNWGAWNWPDARAQKKALHDTASRKTTGPTPSSVVPQGVLSVGAEFRKEVR